MYFTKSVLYVYISDTIKIVSGVYVALTYSLSPTNHPQTRNKSSIVPSDVTTYRRPMWDTRGGLGWEYWCIGVLRRDAWVADAVWAWLRQNSFAYSPNAQPRICRAMKCYTNFTVWNFIKLKENGGMHHWFPRFLFNRRPGWGSASFVLMGAFACIIGWLRGRARDPKYP